ncbi:MAG: adenylate/guanylate cyclase domain-containing protein [Verrucomicrobiaceae bacterium]|nr:adenylate/guanylate cyclase domain-containing protein [Verrucomicrobiaceae bacterium]
MRKREVKHLTLALTSLGGSLLVTVVGLITLHLIFAGTLARASYDLPFRWRGARDTGEITIVYLDDDSAKKLNQPFGGAWDRALYTQLLERLTNEGARLVVFDIVFDAAAADPTTDEAFANAIRRNGRVILGAAVDKAEPLGGVAQERIVPPTRVLRKAAAAWGLLEFRPIDPDNGVRRMYLGTAELAAATVKSAEALGVKLRSDPQAQNRWLNYYRPPNEFSSVSFAQVIQPEGLPAGFFKDRIVLVGGRAAIGYVGMQRDEFATPYTRFTGKFSTGVEVHATILLNLLAGRDSGSARAHVVGWLAVLPGSTAAKGAAPRLRLLPLVRYGGPHRGLGFRSHPCGKTVEATVMFTDLENFTTLSEDLDPAEVSKTLIAYFERTTRCILDRKGTIIKYVGDAVHAGWGAPVEEPDHALRAAEAACDLRSFADMEVRGHRLRTRVGINTGPVLAGNLGSSYRFDYAMIGDTTNFAARLESLNKHLGTQVLVAESTRAALRDRFIVRPLGEFRVSGKTQSILIHELLCPCDAENGERRWIKIFEAALEKFRAGDLAAARELMKKTEQVRGSRDGPSRFYLETIATFEASALTDDWTGIVAMHEK